VDGMNLLMDTGLGYSTVHNAEAMGFDLSSVDKILLSHGHMDHTGGLRDVLERMRFTVGHSNFLEKREGEIEIIAHPDMWGPKYILHPGDRRHSFRGVPFQRLELEERQGARFRHSSEPVWLSEDIVWSGEIPMVNDFEKGTAICYLKEGENEFVHDPVNDDAAVYIKTELGLVVILGCAHHGTINTLHHAQQLTGMDEVYMVVGGTHLVRSSEYQLSSTIAELKKLDVKRVGVSHCTGMQESIRLGWELGDAFFFNNAGTVVSFP
jgi:7,8-dihydropterin-6-yl-methyl-4-(beta-D-ribofuranosyl)aminobenzene 5'-phosphate synthase